MRRYHRQYFAEQAGAGAEPPASPPPIVTVPLVCAIDSLTHEVDDEEFTRAESGRYRALCGTVVAASPMSVPEGRRCDRCAEAREQASDSQPRRGRLARRTA